MLGSNTNQRGEIERLRSSLREYRETTYVGRLVGGIIMTAVGGFGSLYCLTFLLSSAPFKQLLGSYQEYKTMRGLHFFLLFVAVVLIIAGICMIRSYVLARSHRTMAIDHLKEELEKLERGELMPRDSVVSVSGSREASGYRYTTGPVQLAGGSWRCTCGRVNPSYVGTCACGRNKNGVNEAEVAERRRKMEEAAARAPQPAAAPEVRAQPAAPQEAAPQPEVKAEKQPEAAPVNWTQRIEALKGLKELLDAGILTQEEFEQQKKLILNGEAAPAAEAAPVEAVPVEAVPVVEEPAEEVPAEAPAEEAPAEEVPVEEVPVEEILTEAIPAEEVPAQEAPIEAAPVEEAAAPAAEALFEEISEIAPEDMPVESLDEVVPAPAAEPAPAPAVVAATPAEEPAPAPAPTPAAEPAPAAPAEERPVSPIKYCTKCGKPNYREARFCVICGNPFRM